MSMAYFKNKLIEQGASEPTRLEDIPEVQNGEVNSAIVSGGLKNNFCPTIVWVRYECPYYTGCSEKYLIMAGSSCSKLCEKV